MPIDIEKIRSEFPILSQQIRGQRLVYLDNGATTHKPKSVIDKVTSFYETTNSNVHRGVHYLSEKATLEFENARKNIAKFISAKSKKEVIFTRGTTESINLVAQSYGRAFLKEGDEVIITAMEHHSNIVPWQMLREQIGIVLKVAPMDENGELIFEEYQKLLSEKTKFVSLVHVSNSLGTINPVKEMINEAKKFGAKVLIDAAQSIQHFNIAVNELGCDFLAFSGHKIYAPTGIGVLWGRQDLLEKMPPYQGGGDMILTVSFEKTIYNDLPYKFEAGTPNISGAIGLSAAIDYVSNIGLDNIFEYEDKLLRYTEEKLSNIDGLRIIGNAMHKASAVSFILDNVHPHDVGTLIDQEGIAIRTGHHCTEPVMKFFKIPATSRASFAFYNTFEEIDALHSAIIKIKKMFD